MTGGAHAAAWTMGAVLALPLALGLAVTLQQGAGAMAELWAWPGLRRAALLSIGPGLAATVVSVGLVILLMALRPPGMEGLRRALAPLLALPHAAAALGLAFLIAPSGWGARVLAPVMGWTAPPDLLLPGDALGLSLTLGLVLKETPFLLLVALAAEARSLDHRRLAAATMGYGRVTAFALTVWPALYPQVRLPVLAVLSYAMTTVDMGLILGPTLPHSLSVSISLWMTEPNLAHQDRAAAGALVQLALTGLAIALWLGAERTGGALLRALARRGLRGRALDRLLAPFALVTLGLLITLPGLGLLALALWSLAGLWSFPDFFPQALSLAVWTRAAPDLVAASLTTVGLAAISALIAVFLTIAVLETRTRPGKLEALLYLPLILPQIAVLPGLARALILLPVPPLPAVLVAHLTYVLPYVYLTLAGPWRAWEGRMALIGATLGAGRLTILLRLRLPMLAPALAAALAIGFAVSVAQYLPTLLIGGGRVVTVTTEAVALASGANRRVTGAYALLQSLWPALAFALAARIRRA